MSNRDALAIFMQFWPDEGYEGIRPHLPEWSQKRAAKFAWRNGIKMTSDAKLENQRRNMEKARSARGVVTRSDTVESRFLSARL